MYTLLFAIIIILWLLFTQSRINMEKLFAGRIVEKHGKMGEKTIGKSQKDSSA